MTIQQLGILELGALAVALTALITLAAWIVKKVNKGIVFAVEPIKAELQEAIANNREASLSTLRYSITRAHEKYMERGSIGRHSLQCVHDMYDRYKKLGGNSFVETLVKQLHELPFSDGEAEKREVT